MSSALRGEDEVKTLRRFLHSQRRLSDFESIGSYYVRAAADLLKQPAREQFERLWRKTRRILGRPMRANAAALASKTSLVPTSPPTDGAVPPGPLGDAYNDACTAYIPLKYDGPMVLLWPREEPPPSRGPAAGWEKVCSRITVVEVAGHHHSCISVNANVVHVGHAMRNAIEQSEGQTKSKAS